MVIVESSNEHKTDVTCVGESGADDSSALPGNFIEKVTVKPLTTDCTPTTTTSTPKSSGTTNAVTPGTAASSSRGLNNSNRGANISAPSTSDSFVISESISSNSYENAATQNVSNKTDSDNNGITTGNPAGSARSSPSHFTFDVVNSKPATNTLQQESQQPNTNANTDFMNNVPIVVMPTPTSRSRSPTITTSRRGGRSSPVTSLVRASPPPLNHNSRSSTPVNFISGCGGDATARLHSLPAPTARGGFDRPSQHFKNNNNNMHGYGDALSSVAAAAAAAAAAASSGKYYTEGQQHRNAASVTPAHGTMRNSNRYDGRRPATSGNEDMMYPSSSHPHRASGSYAGQQAQHHQQRAGVANDGFMQCYTQQGQPPFRGDAEPRENSMRRKQRQESNPSPPASIYGNIHTFSHSGSLRGSGDLQEQARFPSRSYDNYTMPNNTSNNGRGPRQQDQYSTAPSHYPPHQAHQGYINRSSPTILPDDHDRGGDSRGHSQTTRASPNFTIYHNQTPRQAVPPFSKSGTVVLGGNTPIHITHNSHDVMKEYESSHGVGRSVHGRSSARSVFRNKSSYRETCVVSGSEGKVKSSAMNRGGVAAPPPSYGNSKLTANRFHQEQQYRESDKNSRNAPSPSLGGVGELSCLLTPARQQVIHDEDLIGMATPSILDLPEDSPQRILLSLRTPSMSASHSFDWRDGSVPTKAETSEGKGSDDDEGRINTAELLVLSPPENQRLTQHRSNKAGFADGLFAGKKTSCSERGESTAVTKTHVASPSGDKSPMNSSFSMSALPSPPHYTNSNGEQIEIANSFSFFNPSSFDSLAECTQLQKRDNGDNIISLSQFGSEVVESHQIGKREELYHSEGRASQNHGDCATTTATTPSFSLGVDISMGIGTIQTVGMTRSSDSMSLLDFGPMASRTGSFGERRGSLRANNSIDGFSDGVESPPQVFHQYSSQQHYHSISSTTKSQPLPYPQTSATLLSSSNTIDKRAHNDDKLNPALINNDNRSNSYGSHYSSGTSGSGPNIFYPDICIAPGEASIPGFYYSLIRMRDAFEEFSFLLPGLKMALKRGRSKLVVDVVLSPDADPSAPGLQKLPNLSESDMVVAKRRVIAAVCAFGGSRCKSKLKQSDRGSIFRNVGSDEKNDIVTGRPYEYDEYFSKRYYENENRISWAFEETPPVISSEEASFLREQQKQHQLNGGESNSPRKPGLLIADHDDRNDRSDSDLKSSPSSPTKRDSANSPSKNNGQPKMRYRCKLCGQPKQNHVCPYQQSLQRSIGISVYPAVNAFTADEPGRLAPSLTEMNNFVCDNTDGSPDRPSINANNLVSPNSTRPKSVAAPTGNNSPSTFYSTPFRSKTGVLVKTNMSTPFGTVNSEAQVPFPAQNGVEHHNHASASKAVSRKRHIGQVSASSSEDEVLFMKPMELRPEQFRTVTPRTVPSRSSNSEQGSYCYPQLPLPYKQRKSLSDNLFSLSKEVQHLTDECAVVLKEAREKDMWDLAVSELMTQVIVVLHCPVNDSAFEGLKNYLLTLGIAC